MTVVAAAIALDNVSTNWSVRMNWAEAQSFAHHRTVRYTLLLGDIITAMFDIMDGDYSTVTVGRECSRVLYLEGYIGTAKIIALRALTKLCDEFDITQDSPGGWTKLRMWWD